jgi:hypothetical protein
VVPITAGVPGAAQIVPGVSQLFGVACSSVSSCIADGYVYVPAGGCGQNCMTSVAVGTVVAITNGIAGSPQQVQGSQPNTFLNGVACVPASASCVVVGESGSADPQGLAVPVNGGVAGSPVPVSGGALSGISCPSASGCLAVGVQHATAGVIVPVGLDGQAGTAQPEPGTSGLSSIECADLSSCIAIGQADPKTGAIVAIGASTVSPITAVSDALGVAGATGSINSILRTGAYPTTFVAPGAGEAKISWYRVPAGATLARASKPILVAHGSRRFTKAATEKLKVALTATGRTLLKSATRLKLVAVGSFTPPSGKSITKRKAITLKRH